MTSAKLLGAITLPGTAHAPSQARQFVNEILGPAREATLDAVLLVSELVTNSWLHSASSNGGKIAVLVLAFGDQIIRIEVVDDGGPMCPAVRPVDESDVHGRGLFLVAQLATTWGHLCDQAGTTTWFTIDPSGTPGRHPSTAACAWRAQKPDMRRNSSADDPDLI